MGETPQDLVLRESGMTTHGEGGDTSLKAFRVLAKSLDFILIN